MARISSWPKHLVVARFFYVEDFPLQRQNRLVAAIAALFGGSACRLALNQIQFAAFRTALAAVRQFAGQTAAIERTFAPGKIAGLAGGFASTRRFNRLVDDAAGDGRILFQEHSQPLVQKGLHGAADVGIQLALGLAFKLRLRQLDADHSHQAFADIISGEILFQVFEETHLLTGCVDGARERCAKAGKMCSAIDGIDVVREGEDGLRIAVVILHRDFHHDIVALRLHINRFVVEGLLAAVQMLDELRDAAAVFELRMLGFAGFRVRGALIGQRDFQALVQEGQLAQPLRQCVVVIFGDRKNGLVGKEVDLRPAFFAGSCLLQLVERECRAHTPAHRYGRRARSPLQTARSSH